MRAKRFCWIVGVVGLLVVIAWTGTHLWSGVEVLASADPQQRWEYRVVYNNYHQETNIFSGTYNALDSNPQLTLNSAGSEGWKLIAVNVGSSGHTHFFKRPLF